MSFERSLLLGFLFIGSSWLVVDSSKVIAGSQSVVRLDLTLFNGTQINGVELPSSYAWVSLVMTEQSQEFTANIIPIDIPANEACTISNPREETEGQIGIARITRKATRQNYVNFCNSFQLIGVAQRVNFLRAVILIRNDSKLNDEYESGYVLDSTMHLIFTEQQAYDGIIEQYGGESAIQQISARLLPAPEEVIVPWREHVVQLRAIVVVASLLSGITLVWAIIVLPFRQKYYPLNAKTMLVFIVFIAIIILASFRMATYPVDYRGYQGVYPLLTLQLLVFAGDTMVGVVFSVVVVAWLEISIWKSKARASRILRFCCLGFNLALLISLFVTAVIDGVNPSLGAIPIGNVILAIFLLLITIGFMIAGGRLLHLMKKIDKVKTERDNRDKVLKTKVAIVLTVIGVLGFYAVVSNIVVSLLPVNANQSMGIEFSLRFAENLALWLMLWFFTDSIVNQSDSTGSISSGKSKSQFSSRKVKTSAGGLFAGSAAKPEERETGSSKDNEKSSIVMSENENNSGSNSSSSE